MMMFFVNYWNLVTVFKPMKNLTTIAILLIGMIATAQKESFAFTTYVDPKASIENNGLDIGFDIEYKGFVYVKAGIESFTELPGGYFDIHGAVGPRFTFGMFENWAVYAGGRGGVVFRNGAPNPIGGIEAGIDYVFDSGLLIGLNGSYMYRGDMHSMGWEPIWRENGYIRIGYQWNW